MKPTTVEGVGSLGEDIYLGRVKPAGADVNIEFDALDLANESGAEILEGSVVVVVDDGTIELASTGETRPIGIALDGIDDGDSGPVQFAGPVDLILVTASVTAGEFAVLSATPGEADADASPGFALFTTSGTEPEGFLYGHSGGGGGEPTADDHIADTSDAHDASAVSLLDSAGLFTATDVEAAIAELAAKDIGYQAHGNMGATETFSAATGWHSGTFNADCTFTFSGATSGIVASMVLELTEDGTGTWTPTWPGSVVWPGGVAPTHDETGGTTTLYLFQSRDGGTTWYGFQAGGGTSSVGALDDLSDVTITTPAEDDQLQYVGGVWVNNARRWEAVTDGEDVFVWESDDLVHEWETY